MGALTLGTVLVAGIIGALAAFSVEWLFKPRLEVRADTLRARRDVMLALRYFLQVAAVLDAEEIWQRAPEEGERRASMLLEEARRLELLLPRTVRKGWVHWRWPEVARAVSKLSGYLQGRLLSSSDSITEISPALEGIAHPLIERDGTSRLFWRHRGALLERATRAATRLDIDNSQSGDSQS